MLDVNPRVKIGGNEEADATNPINEVEREKVIRVCQAEYNAGSQVKRHAAEKLRDLKGDFRVKNAAEFETINAIMLSAKEKLTGGLRSMGGYVDAEDEKRDGSLRMKAALKTLKDAGFDVQAFKIANKMADMDQIEREEFFDAIDLAAKALRLWGGSDY